MPAEIRLALARDARGIAIVHVDTWRTTYKGLLHDGVLEKLSYETREARWNDILALPRTGTASFTLVAEDAGRVVGFASGGAEREKDRVHTGELTALYVLDSAHGLGLGRRLVAQVARGLVARGHRSMLVWVLAGNPACGFYQHMGGVELRTKKAEIGGVLYDEIAYGWRDLGELLSLPGAKHDG